MDKAWGTLLRSVLFLGKPRSHSLIRSPHVSCPWEKKLSFETFEMPPAQEKKNEKRRCQGQNGVLTPEGENNCEEKIMAILRG
ncbi:hypothetical protein Tco_0333398 [Tanacetum coccineum]